MVVLADAADLSNDDQDLGYFTPLARVAATEQSLPLLATYFAAAPTWSLEAAPVVGGEASTSDEDLGAFVRMRVALAAARRLEPLVRRVLSRPSFFYGREAEESIGVLTGPLDIGRYMKSRLRVDTPRRFPIQAIRRRYATPENVAAAYASAWISAELARAPLHVLPESSPEYVEIIERRSRLADLLRHPVLAEAMPAARDCRRAGALSALLEQSRTRLERGHISARDAYEDLFTWFEAFDPERAIAAPGAVEWAFYDSRFDTKLFEIWALGLLEEVMTALVGPPIVPMPPLYERDTTPLVEWHCGACRLRLYFQASLAALGTEEQLPWRYTEGGTGPLRGFPDLALTIEHVAGSRRVALIDPKLRQRARAPTEELYKLLGYFGNLQADQAPLGAIIYYSPDAAPRYRLERTGGGVLLAVGVDPVSRNAARQQFEAVARLVLDAAGLSPEQVTRLREASTGEEAEEATTSIRQAAVVQAMVDAVAVLPDASLAPVRKVTAAQLSGIWDRLTPETRTMLVTAEYFGQNAPDDADHSGPLLGLAASCERVLYEFLIADLVAEQPVLFDAGATLGTVIRWLTDGCREHPKYPEGMFIRQALMSGALVNVQALCHTTGDLRRLNHDFRIPAAHRELIPNHTWVAGRALVLDPGAGLLVRLTEALRPESNFA